MERIEGLSIGLSLDTININSGLKDLKSKLSTVNSELKANLSGFDRADKSIDKYQTTLNGLNKKLQVQTTITDKARKTYQKMVEEHGEGSIEAEKAARAFNNESAKLQDLQRSVDRTKRGLKELQEQQRIAGSGWTKLSNGLKATGDNLTSVGNGVKDIGKKMSMAITAPVAALAGTAIAKGLSRLIGIDEAKAKLDGLGHSTKSIESIMGSALDAVRGTAFGLDEAATTAANAVAAGVEKGEDLTKYLTLTGDAAAIAGTSLGEMGSVFNKVQASGKAYNGELQQLSDRGLPIYQWLAEEAEVGADAVFEMASKGLISSEMLLSAVENNIGGAAKKMGTKSFTAGISNMWAAVGRLGASFLDAGGKGGGFFSQMKPLLADFTNNIDGMGSYAEKMGVAFGAAFSGIIQKGKAVASWFKNLSDFGKKLTLALGAIAVAAGPVLTFAGMFIVFLGNIASALAPVAASIAKAGGLLKWLRLGFVALSGPVGITIAVITALTTGFIILYKKSDTFRGMVGKLIGVLKDLGGKVMVGLKSAISAVVSFFNSQLKVLKSFWKENSDTIMVALNNIGKVVSVIFKGIMAVIQFVMPAVLAIIKSIWNNIKGVIQGTLKVIMGLVQAFAGLLSGDFSKMWSGIKKIFSGALQAIWNGVQLMFWGKMLKGIVGLSKTLTGTFKSMWSSIQKTFSTVIKAIVDFVKNSFNTMNRGINSIFTGIKNFITGIWKAIRTNIQNPVKAAVDYTKSRFGNLKDKTVEIFSNIKKKVTGYVSDMVTAVRNMPGKMKDGLVKMSSKITEGVTTISNKMAKGLGKGVNGVINGVNWVTDKLGIKSKISEWDVPQYAKGTKGHPGGLAVVGDGKGRNAGSELIQTPDGKTMLSPANDTLVNLPKGSQVLSALETKSLLGDIPKYAKGIGGMIQSGVKKAKDFALNIWDYATNPGKLLDIALETLGVSKPDNSNLVGKIARGGFNKVKGSAVNYVKDMFAKSEAEGGNVQAPNFGGRFRRTSGFGPRWGRLHGGVDYAAPIGTPIPSQSNGVVSFAANGWNGGFGNLVKVKQGIYEHFYAHMSRIMTRAGQRVSKGSILGLVGSTGDSTGPHVHYELRKNGVRLNPGNVGFATGGLINNPGMYNLAEGGFPEWVIPTDPKRRTDAMKLLALAGRDIGGNKRPNQLPNPSGGSYQGEEIALLKQQVQLLTQLVMAAQNIEKKPVLTEGDVGRATERYDAGQTIKKNIFSGRGAWA